MLWHFHEASIFVYTSITQNVPKVAMTAHSRRSIAKFPHNTLPQDAIHLFISSWYREEIHAYHASKSRCDDIRKDTYFTVDYKESADAASLHHETRHWAFIEARHGPPLLSATRGRHSQLLWPQTFHGKGPLLSATAIATCCFKTGARASAFTLHWKRRLARSPVRTFYRASAKSWCATCNRAISAQNSKFTARRDVRCRHFIIYR